MSFYVLLRVRVQVPWVLKSEMCRHYVVSGSRRGDNIAYAMLSFLATLGFFAQALYPVFFSCASQGGVCENRLGPQGLVCLFYGLIAFGFCAYLTLIMGLNIGSGWNIFNMEERYVRIFRWGFPGQNRRIDLCYTLESILAIEVRKTAFGGQLYLNLKDQRQIPFCSAVGMGFEPIEGLASDLGQFLKKEVLILT